MDFGSKRRSSSLRFRAMRTSRDDSLTPAARYGNEENAPRLILPPHGMHRHSTHSGEVPSVPLASDAGDSDSDSSLKLEEDLATLEAQAKRREQQQSDEQGPDTLAPADRRKPRMSSMVPAIKRVSSVVLVSKKRSNSVGGLRSLVSKALPGRASHLPGTQATQAILNILDEKRRESSVPPNFSRGSKVGSRQGSPAPSSRRLDPNNFSSSPVIVNSDPEQDKQDKNTSRTASGFSRRGSASSTSRALGENALVEGLRWGAIQSLARVAVYKTGKELIHEIWDLRCTDGIILLGGETSSDSVFIVDEGRVQMEENGEKLGMISKGGIFGEGSAFGHSEVQPFTVRLTEERDFACWCIPTASVRYTLRQFPDAKLLLEERIAEQTKKLLGPRAFRLLFFSHCGVGFQERLLPKMRTSYYCKGSEIIKGGEEAEAMLMVVSGGIKLGNPSKAKSPKARSVRRSTLSAKSAISLKTFDTKETEGDGDTVVDDDSSSMSSGDSSDEGEFLPKVSAMRSSPKVATVVSEALCFGEGILLGFHTTMGRRVSAVQDCIVLSLGKEDFTEVVERHPRERSSFQEFTNVRYQEFRRSDLARLANVDLFCRCQDAFLAKVAKVSVLQLFFPGSFIIAEGFVPKGVLLLMGGRAEQVTEEGDVTKVDSPHSFGTLAWLGVSDEWQSVTLRAIELCLVFLISREHLLEALKEHPSESTAMVAQALRHNGIRMSVCPGDQNAAKQVGVVTASNRRHNARPNVWHMPFCNGLDPAFVGRLTVELQVCRLVPGQMVFSPAPQQKRSDQRADTVDQKDEDLDFVVVLLNGTVQIDDTPRNSDMAVQNWKHVHSPLFITGFNRRHRAMVITASACEIHRLTMSSCSRLCKEFPKELRKVLYRMLEFQRAREVKLGASWWCPTKSLRHQAWFEDSDEDFLHAVVENLHTELFLPGDVLVVEGDIADSTMLLECGTVVIEKVDTRSLYSSYEVGNVHDGYWIGEMAMFAGESKRRASIKAVTACKIQRLYNKVLVSLLDNHPTERQRFRLLAEERLRAVEKERLEDLDFFKDLDRSFLNLLRQRCNPKVFFANEIMMKEGDIADSLFILGQDSMITMESDGYKGKKMMGRSVLGTKALLSARPVKRASTVISQNVCAVRVLTRDDWLDALKSCPEHQRWLTSFTKQQMAKISEGRTAFLKRRAWDKIQEREVCATLLHCERVADPDFYVKPYRRRHPRQLESIDRRTESRATQPSVGTPRQVIPVRPPPHPPHEWECFNGMKAKVPHTSLPQLGNLQAEVLAMLSSDGDDEEEQRLVQSPSRQSFLHTECEEALGVSAN